MDIKKVTAIALAVGLALPIVETLNVTYTSDITVSADEINYIDSAEYNQRVKEMIYYLNEYRESKGLAPLKTCDTMNSLAQKRALEQEITGMSHTRPSGEKFSTIFAENGVVRNSSAENLYMTSADIDPQNAIKYWKTSSGHNANMLGDYDYVGVSVIYIDGYYYWLQLFCTSDDAQITDNAYLITKEDIAPVTTTTETTTTAPVTTTTEVTTTTAVTTTTEVTTTTAVTTTTEVTTTTTQPQTQTDIITDTEPTPTETTNNFINGVYGDVNSDGVANVVDLLLLKKLILGIPT
jgi:uncharacterized protein YkwD